MTYEQDELARIKVKLLEAQVALSLALVQLGLLQNIMSKESGVLPKPYSQVAKPAPAAPVVEEPLVINEEWKAVLDSLNNGKEHLFITGEAGTGKSTLLKHFTEQYDGCFAIVAPTGVAALRVGGETIHRFFGFGAHAIATDDIPVLSDTRRAKYRALDVLVIDEISMVRADLMDAIDKFLRKNGRNATLPFGGVRLVMFGDLFQLSPISKEADEKKWLTSLYGTDMPYFFHAEVWRKVTLKKHNLSTIFRQKDPTFTSALNAIRSGTATAEHLKLINSRVNTSFKAPLDGKLWLTLTTTNNSADQSNQRMLAALKTKSEVFEAKISGDFDLKNAPTDELLELKPGAVVMFIRNNRQGGWVNGTLGKVTSIDPLKVEIDDIEHEVDKETWEAITYEYSEETKKLTKTIRGKFEQIPLKLASAITIHKSQGLTFEQVIVDFASGAFAAGQAYVALSRCRTLDGMVLRRAVQDRDLIVSTEVQHFMAGEPIARPAGQLSLLGVEA